MKIYLFLLLSTFLLFSNNSISQSDLKYEIDISLLSVTPVPKQFRSTREFRANVINNFQFKVNTHDVDYRVSLGVSAHHVEVMEPITEPIVIGSFREFQMAFGFSKKLLSRKHSPYAGMDLIVSLARSDVEQRGGTVSLIIGYKEDYLTYGISTFMGYQYQISERISASAEISIQFLKSVLENQPYQNIYEFLGFNITFLPLSRLSINYHF